MDHAENISTMVPPSSPGLGLGSTPNPGYLSQDNFRIYLNRILTRKDFDRTLMMKQVLQHFSILKTLRDFWSLNQMMMKNQLPIYLLL